MTDPEQVAQELLKMAARKSVQTKFGWAHPDCVVLSEAARIIRGEPQRKPDPHPIGVLSQQ